MDLGSGRGALTLNILLSNLTQHLTGKKNGKNISLTWLGLGCYISIREGADFTGHPGQ